MWWEEMDRSMAIGEDAECKYISHRGEALMG
jgi:hypothetical protein